MLRPSYILLFIFLISWTVFSQQCTSHGSCTQTEQPKVTILRSGENIEEEDSPQASNDSPQTSNENKSMPNLLQDGDVNFTHPLIYTVSNQDQFNQLMKNNEFVLLEYYAPWCGFCVKFVPVFQNLTLELEGMSKNSKFPRIQSANLDCDENKPICKSNKITSYPTINLYQNGELVSEFTQNLDQELIMKWLNSFVKPQLKEIKTIDQYQSLLDKHGQIGIVFASSLEDDFVKPLITTINTLKLQRTEIPQLKYYIIVGDVQHLQKFQPDAQSGFLSIVKSYEKQAPKQQDFSSISPKQIKQTLISFLNKHGHPLIGSLNLNLIEKLESQGKNMGVIYLDVNSKSILRRKSETLLLKPALKYRDSLQLFYAPYKKWSPQLRQMGIRKTNLPILNIYISSRNQQYLLDNTTTSVTSEVIEQFVDNVFDGKVPPYYISEPIPKENSGNVLKIVGKTFDSIVNVPKDVLLYVKSSWCGQCKKFEKLVLDRLVDYFEPAINQSSLIIGSINMELNEVKQLNSIDDAPTVVFFDKNNKMSIYSKKLSASFIINWVKSIATISKEQLNQLEPYKSNGKDEILDEFEESDETGDEEEYEEGDEVGGEEWRSVDDLMREVDEHFKQSREEEGGNRDIDARQNVSPKKNRPEKSTLVENEAATENGESKKHDEL